MSRAPRACLAKFGRGPGAGVRWRGLRRRKRIKPSKLARDPPGELTSAPVRIKTAQGAGGQSERGQITPSYFAERNPPVAIEKCLEQRDQSESTGAYGLWAIPPRPPLLANAGTNRSRHRPRAPTPRQGKEAEVGYRGRWARRAGQAVSCIEINAPPRTKIPRSVGDVFRVRRASSEKNSGKGPRVPARRTHLRGPRIGKNETDRPVTFFGPFRKSERDPVDERVARPSRESSRSPFLGSQRGRRMSSALESDRAIGRRERSV